MEALNFIKTYHKEYLDKSKIDNNVYDNENHNYKYYYDNIIIDKLLRLNTAPKKYINYLLIEKRIEDTIILPTYFDKYEFINLSFCDIIINDRFNKLSCIFCNSLIINNEMNELIKVNIKKKLVINNKTKLEKMEFWKNNVKVKINYPIKNTIEIYARDTKIYNNTDNEIVLLSSQNKFYTFVKPKTNIIMKY